MSCIKTGFHAFLVPHELYVYGDAFKVNNAYIFRICSISPQPQRPVKHFTIEDWSLWFDEHKTSQSTNSTMLCWPQYVIDHGYNGTPINKD